MGASPKESQAVLLARLEERAKTLFDNIHLLQAQTTGFEARLKESVARIEDIADQVQKIMFRQEGPDGSIERLRNLEEITDHIEKDVDEVKRVTIKLGIMDARQGAIDARVTTLERIPERAKWASNTIRLVALVIVGASAVLGAITALYLFFKNLGGH